MKFFVRVCSIDMNNDEFEKAKKLISVKVKSSANVKYTASSSIIDRKLYHINDYQTTLLRARKI